MIFQLEYKESGMLLYWNAHGKHGVTFDWLLHTYGCHVKDKWHVKVKFQKGQELAKLSKHKARNVNLYTAVPIAHTA